VVTNMALMFLHCSFNQDLSSWDVSAVANMEAMFADTSSFNQDLSSWDVSAVTSMNSMFFAVSGFNQYLCEWDVSAVTTFNQMFAGNTLFDKKLCWTTNTADVTGMFNTGSEDLIGCDPTSSPTNRCPLTPSVVPSLAPAPSPSPSNSPHMFEIVGDISSATTLTSRNVDANLYRQAAGEKIFNITTVRMESTFNEENMQNEIHVVYDYYAPSDILNTTYDLRLYQKDCVTHGENSNVGANYISVSTSNVLYKRNAYADGASQLDKSDPEQVHLAGNDFATQSQIDIPLDIHQAEVFSSPYFEYLQGSHYTMAEIVFCARFVMFYDIDNDGLFSIHQSDPYLEVEAVQFHETLVILTFNLTQDFQVSAVQLKKDDIIERSDNQRLKYGLDVYHCEPKENSGYTDYINNDTYTEVSSPTGRVITQSTIIYICITLTGSSANIGIREMAQLEFVQPASQITSFAIYQRTTNAITSELHYGDSLRKRMVVSTRLVLPFFDNKDPSMNSENREDGSDYDGKSSSNVLVKGTVIMMFQDDTNMRRNLISFNRDLQEAGQETEEYFEIELGLGMNEKSAGNNYLFTVKSLFAFLLFMFGVM